MDRNKAKKDDKNGQLSCGIHSLSLQKTGRQSLDLALFCLRNNSRKSIALSIFMMTKKEMLEHFSRVQI